MSVRSVSGDEGFAYQADSLEEVKVVSKETEILRTNDAAFAELVSGIRVANAGESKEAVEVTHPVQGKPGVIQTKIYSGLNLDGDEYADFVVLQSIDAENSHYQDGQRSTYTFLGVVFGDESTEGLTELPADIMKQGAVYAVESSSHADPMESLYFSDHDADGVAEISYKVDSSDQKPHMIYAALGHEEAYWHRNVDLTPWEDLNVAKQIARDAKLAAALNDVNADYEANATQNFAFYLSHPNADVKQAAQPNYYGQMGTLIGTMALPFSDITRSYVSVTGDSVHELQYRASESPTTPWLDYMGRLAFQTDFYLSRMSAEQTAAVNDAFASADKTRREARASLRWNGEALDRHQFNAALEKEADPKKRTAMVAEFAAVADAARSEGGLFDAIATANATARDAGVDGDYRDYQLGRASRLQADGVAQVMDDFHAANEGKIKDYVAELQRLSGDAPVHIYDEPYLRSQMISERVGERDLTITAEQALEVVHRFFGDMGIDLTQPPYSNGILQDMYQREGKLPGAFALMLEDGSTALMHANLDPDEPVSLKYLASLIHEYGHCIESVASAYQARGNSNMGGAASPMFWSEGLGTSLDFSVYTQGFLDRYLSGYENFEEAEVRDAVADAYEGSMVFYQMMLAVRARYEMELYRDQDDDGNPIPVNDRLASWEDFVGDYLHVGAQDARVAAWIWNLPHPTNNHLHYANYSVGFPYAQQVVGPFQEALKSGDEAEIARTGARIRMMMETGVSLQSYNGILSRLDEVQED